MDPISSLIEQLRVQLDQLFSNPNTGSQARAIALAKTKLDECEMWVDKARFLHD